MIDKVHLKFPIGKAETPRGSEPQTRMTAGSERLKRGRTMQATIRQLLFLGGGLWLLAGSGCAMCANPHDCKFAAYGGLRERTDMVHGRVASVFDPAPEVIQGGPSQQSPTPAPLAPDGELIPPPDSGGELGNGIRPPADAFPPSAESTERPSQSPSPNLPELPEGGTIELPDLDLDRPPSGPSRSNDDGRERLDEILDEAPHSARHPLYDIFSEFSEGR